MLKSALTAAAALALVVPAAAQAHVTLQPDTGVAGTYTRLDVRVPNERDDASTSKVEVQFPDGFASASYEPVPGWRVKVTTKRLAEPIATDDGEITEGVDTITWTADDDEDAIPPGAFMDFGLSVQIPGQAGDSLTFKALQTYTGGEVVRWIGGPGSENPAPTVSVTAGNADAESTATPTPTEAASQPVATDGNGSSGGAADDDSGNGLAVTALIVGALGLLVGIAGFATGRRARTA
jgi:periplasmic copper chaperone A